MSEYRKGTCQLCGSRDGFEDGQCLSCGGFMVNKKQVRTSLPPKRDNEYEFEAYHFYRYTKSENKKAEGFKEYLYKIWNFSSDYAPAFYAGYHSRDKEIENMRIEIEWYKRQFEKERDDA